MENNTNNVIAILDAILSEDGNALCADERYFNVYDDRVELEFHARTGQVMTRSMRLAMEAREEIRYANARLRALSANLEGARMTYKNFYTQTCQIAEIADDIKGVDQGLVADCFAALFGATCY
jgi:hypothetical protein